MHESTLKTKSQERTPHRKVVLGGLQQLLSLSLIAALLLAANVVSGQVKELSNIRPAEDSVTIWTAADCPTVVESANPVASVPGVDVVTLSHLGAYKLTPRARGRYTLPCGTGTITLCVSPALPKANAGFGFYTSPRRFAIPRLEGAYLHDAAAHGMNTLVAQADSLPGEPVDDPAKNLARQLNAAAEAGLMDVRFPVLCLSIDLADLVRAQEYRRYPWPELIMASIDEPNNSQEKALAKNYADGHARGMRVGTAVAGYACTGYVQRLPWCAPEDVGKKVPGIGQYLDIWNVLVGTLTEQVSLAARDQEKELWAYNAYLDGSNAPLHRWTFGLWAWRAKTRVNLIWAYIDKGENFDNSRVIETPEGPLSTAAYEGLSEGVTDYRVLQAVAALETPEARAWLRKIEASSDLGWWPKGYVRPPAEQKAQVPTVDMATVREEGLRLLAGSDKHDCSSAVHAGRR